MENLCLAHYGVIGQKWGVRRYQNSDGTLTAAGKARLQQESKTYLRDSNTKGHENRATVSDKMLNYYNKRVYEDGGADWGDPDIDQFWNDLSGEYASALIKDLDMRETAAIKSYIQSILETTGQVVPLSKRS